MSLTWTSPTSNTTLVSTSCDIWEDELASISARVRSMLDGWDSHICCMTHQMVSDALCSLICVAGRGWHKDPNHVRANIPFLGNGTKIFDRRVDAWKGPRRRGSLLEVLLACNRETSSVLGAQHRCSNDWPQKRETPSILIGQRRAFVCVRQKQFPFLNGACRAGV